MPTSVCGLLRSLQWLSVERGEGVKDDAADATLKVCGLIKYISFLVVTVSNQKKNY
jgi:hypothetical protein